MKIIITIISSLIFFSNILYAETNIAYFDVDKVLSNSMVGKSLTSQIRKLNKSNTEKFNKIEEKLKDEDKALLAKKNILSKEDFIKEFNKLKMDVAKYKKTRNTNIKETSIKGVNGTKKLLSIMSPILAKYAVENNISIILDKKNIIIGKTELDITDKILKLIDEKIKPFNLK